MTPAEPEHFLVRLHDRLERRRAMMDAATRRGTRRLLGMGPKDGGGKDGR